MRWITRENANVDRIACPWLIKRFVDPGAVFLFVAPSKVGAVAERFDAALDRLATIVRGADTSRPDLTPQCQGLLAISYGLSANFPNDHEMLKHGMTMYDALYTWCRQQVAKQ